jgi:16S rRNA (guanine966-N2)-methyltransferase
LEQNSQQVQLLQQHAVRFNVQQQVQVVRTDTQKWLQRAPVTPFQMVFLDPPFAKEALLITTWQSLIERGWLTSGAYIYLEQPRHQPWPPLPEQWQFIREQQAGDVRFGLMMMS